MMPVDWDEIERGHQEVEKRLSEQERLSEELRERITRLEAMAAYFELGVQDVSNDSD